MNRFVLVAPLLLSMCATSLGQIVPPAPAKTPATPEYVPPPPPPTPVAPTPVRPSGDPNAAPAQPEKPLPSLIEKDAAGKIKPLRLPVDEAAVRALDLGEEGKTKLSAALESRRLEVGRLVVENLAALLEIQKVRKESSEATTLETMTSTARQAAPFRKNPLLDSLVRAGAISPLQKTHATEVAKEYKQAIREEALKDAGGHGNMQAMALIGFRFTLDDFCGEASRELDRLLDESAPKAKDLITSMNLPADHAAIKQIGSLDRPPAGKSKADALRSIFYSAMNDEERRSYLLLFKPALATPPEPAADAPPASK
ncbi:MAG: hypothetical protein AB7G11_08285 [Phycisphaerales bacterium]